MVAWGIWKQIFEYIADSHAPLKKKRVRKNSAPWITVELKHDMFERDRLKMWLQDLKVIVTGLDTNSEKKSLSYYQESKNNVTKVIILGITLEMSKTSRKE